MGSVDYKFRSARIDQSPYLFHFTKGEQQDAKNILYKIIEERIISSKKKPFICFTASPISSLYNFFDVKVNNTGLPMYQSYGIGFNRDTLIKEYGARNVIYCDNSEQENILPDLQWRCEQLEIGIHDFEYLREWRIKGEKFDFSSFPKDKIIIVAPTKSDLNDLVAEHNVECILDLDENMNECLEWKEVFPRTYKGIALKEISDRVKSDYALLSILAEQKVDEDMLSEIIDGLKK